MRLVPSLHYSNVCPLFLFFCTIHSRIFDNYIEQLLWYVCAGCATSSPFLKVFGNFYPNCFCFSIAQFLALVLTTSHRYSRHTNSSWLLSTWHVSFKHKIKWNAALARIIYYQVKIAFIHFHIGCCSYLSQRQPDVYTLP